MTLQQKAMAYTPAVKLNNPTKKGIQIIGEMPTSRILAHIAYRHRVGLLMASTMALLSYIAWDKIISLFF